MSVAQSPKYAVDDDRIITNRKTGEEIPCDEPVMVMVGSNRLACVTIRYYIQQLQDNFHAKAVDDHLNRFTSFAEGTRGPLTTDAIGRDVLDFVLPNEPVMIFRAKDKHAVTALTFYTSQLPPKSHAYDAADELMNDFIEFAADHSDMLKEPDTELVVVES